MNRFRWPLAALAALGAALGAGCPAGDDDPSAATGREVVVYCALDRLYAQPILEAFTAQTGIAVAPKWDAEATKTTGLVETIRAEREHVRCDVFWNNEVGQTAELQRDGLLESYLSPAAEGLPAAARDPQGHWTGFAARARVLIVNTDLVAEADTPSSCQDLLDPRWSGRCGIAKPLFGTTATHVAALFSRDEPSARAWLDGLRTNQVVVCAGNSTVKDLVASGELAVGLTDTDDANLAVLAGQPVRVVFPDQAPGQPGALLIPNSVAIVAGGPHPDEARALVDYLLGPEVEQTLARSRSAQIPLRAGLERASWIPADVRPLEVEWGAVAAAFPGARDYVREQFLGE